MRIRPARQRATPTLLIAAAVAGSAASLLLLPAARAAASYKDWQGGNANWSAGNAWTPGGQPADGDAVKVAQANVTVTYSNAAFPTAVLESLRLDAAGAPTLAQSQDVLTTDHTYIGEYAAGAMQQSGGTHAVTGQFGLALGLNAGAGGAYALSGVGVLDVSGVESVGGHGSGAFTQTGGTHKVSNVAGTAVLSIGAYADSAGMYDMSGGQLQADTIAVSNGGVAGFNHSGGTVTVTGSLTLADNVATGAVQYNLSAAGVLKEARLLVGGIGVATFSQTGGSNTATADFRLGNSPGASGTYDLSGGTLDVSGSFTVGNSGKGTFNASGGKLTLATALNIGAYATGGGTFNLSKTAAVTTPQVNVGLGGAGTLNVAGGSLKVNGSVFVSSSGAGTFNMSGGTVDCANLSLGIVGAPGVSHHTGGSLVVSDALSVNQDSTYHLTGGRLSAGQTFVPSGGVLEVAGTGKFRTGSVNFQGGTGRIDLTDRAFVVDYDQVAAIVAVRDAVATGYANGAWTGPGIRSATAAGDVAKQSGVGFGEASVVLGLTGNQTAQWQGQTVDATAVLVRYTLYGDATLDGVVDFADLVKVAQNYGAPGVKNWADGDFTYDGVVDFKDLVKVAQNYGTGLPDAPLPGAPAGFDADLAAAFASVPEPASAACLLTGGLVFTTRRRSRRPSRSSSWATRH